VALECVAFALAAIALCACQRLPRAELLEVQRALTTELQFGESLLLEGDGFAVSKAADVRLQGRVYRAGRAPRSIDLALRGQADSTRELTVALPRSDEREVFEDPDAASHATFHGDVEVAVAAKEPGMPPATGMLHGATLEFYAGPQTREASARQLELGQKALAFYGIEVTEANAGGLSVLAVSAAGRAARAGLEPGDRILSAGGLSALSAGDLVPAAARKLPLRVQRGADSGLVLLDADGFWPEPPSSVFGAALLLGVVALALSFWASPLARATELLGQIWLGRVRARCAARARAAANTERPYRLLGDSLDTLVWLTIGGALCAPLLRRTPLDLAFGLLSLAFGSATLLTAASLIAGGREGARWSLARGLRAALQRCAVIAPAWLAVLSCCLQSGVDADELVQSQGALPWQWNAFDNPGFTLAFVALLATTLPCGARPNSWLSHARLPAELGAAPSDSLLGAIYSRACCALAALVFLGGDAWPFPPSDPGSIFGVLAALPVLLSFGKYTLLCAAVAALRELAQRLTLAQWAPLSLRYCLPLSLLSLVLGAAWPALAGSGGLTRWALAGAGPLAIGAALAILAGAGLALQRGLRHPAPAQSLSPWI
jgi:NADH-quinone oxidoreductase subunit H